MPNYRPGRSTDTFESRCLKKSVSEICACIGDNLYVDGCAGCYVWHRTLDKREDLGDIQIADSQIAIYWPTCEFREAQCESEVVRLGKRYTIKSGFPLDQHNGWTCAELDYCGVC